jgi:hypothetical protein
MTDLRYQITVTDTKLNKSRKLEVNSLDDLVSPRALPIIHRRKGIRNEITWFIKSTIDLFLEPQQ